MAKPHRAAQLQRWRDRTPLAVVSVLAGQLRLPMPTFLLAGLAARFVRFAALAHGVTLLAGV